MRLACIAPLVLCLPLCSCMMPDHAKQTAANEVYLKKEGIIALEVGQTAPPLSTATDVASGHPADLTPLLQSHERGIILFVVPALDTPNTLYHFRQWEKWRAGLEEKGLGIIGLCPGTAEAVKQWAQDSSLTLPLLADPGNETSRAYGCLAPDATFPQRTAIGVNPEGAVVWFYRGMPPMTEIEKAFGLKDDAKSAE